MGFNKMGTTSNTQIMTLANKVLPALSGDSVRYNANKNTFYTAGYTSLAGNTYYRTFRISDRLCISCNLGQGYAYTFLNGMVVYAWDGSRPRIIGKWTSPGVTFFSDSTAKYIATELVRNYLSSQAKLNGASLSKSQIEECATSLIEETERKQLV